MASLANQTISSTYDGLIKTSTDQPVGVSGVQLLEDGVGNTLALSVGRANQGVTVTGTLTATALSGPLTGNVTGDLTGNVTATSVLADGVIATTQATSDNSTKVATTAFVKSVVTAEDLDIAGDTGTGAVDLDSQTLTIEGTANEIETSASGQTITIGLPSSVTVGTLTATNLGGTLSTAAQTNVTSVGTLSSLAVSGDLTVDTSTLKVDSANNRVGIGTASPNSYDVPNLVIEGSTLVGITISENTGNGTAAINFGATAAFDGKARISCDIGPADLYFSTIGSERMRITSGGDVSITSGNLSFANGSGIDFSASAGGGATSSLLDDYEEGTWTMGVSFGGASVGVTYTSNTGQYTKIGRQVTVTGYCVVSDKGSSTGALTITGLPVAIAGGDSNYVTCSFYLDGGISYVGTPQARGVLGATTIITSEVTEVGAVSGLTNADCTAPFAFMVNMTYFT
jgi:hypothetical protein